MEILLWIIYATAFVAILFFFLKGHRRGGHRVFIETPVATWWPWNISRYNDWPYWSGWYVGGGNGGYIRPPVRPSHHENEHHDRPWGGHGRHTNGGGLPHHGPDVVPPRHMPTKTH